MLLLRILWICLLWVLEATAMSQEQVLATRDKIREMFYHGYNGYMNYAFPMDELQPLTCKGTETWGGYSLTLIDSLDTLVIMGDHVEFNKRVQWVLENIRFEKDMNVSVFETNIRVLGGLLSAHMIYTLKVVDPEPVQYQGGLLSLAADLGYRLLKAFETPTGIPYGTVNFKYGIPPDETEVTSTASGGTFLLEFTLLSKLTGDDVFENAAKRATYGLFERRSSIGLVGAHINVSSGEWTHKDAGIGASIDSFYEYMFKAYILFRDSDYLYMFNESEQAILKYLYKPPWYIEVHMYNGAPVWPVYNSLQGFWPGTQALSGNVQQAKETIRAMHGVWRRFGAVPEGFNLAQGKVQPGQASYPLRPELAESVYYLYRSTLDPIFLNMGRDIIYAIDTRARTNCGFATIHDVETSTLEDRMESFFLSETAKYLYLLFDTNNKFNSGYVFTTEGHPLPILDSYPKDARYQTPSTAYTPKDSIKSPKFPPRKPFTKRDLQCPRPTYWQKISACEMEVKSTTTTTTP